MIFPFASLAFSPIVCYCYVSHVGEALWYSGSNTKQHWDDVENVTESHKSLSYKGGFLDAHMPSFCTVLFISSPPEKYEQNIKHAGDIFA
jgi:hypothetical protein